MHVKKRNLFYTQLCQLWLQTHSGKNFQLIHFILRHHDKHSLNTASISEITIFVYLNLTSSLALQIITELDFSVLITNSFFDPTSSNWLRKESKSELLLTCQSNRKSNYTIYFYKTEIETH